MGEDRSSGPSGIVRSMADIAAHDQTTVTLFVEYRAIPPPERGGSDPGAVAEYAGVVLADGTQGYLETFDTPGAVRPIEERNRFDRKQVSAVGTIHRLMPVRGEGPMEPSLNDIRSLCESA